MKKKNSALAVLLSAVLAAPAGAAVIDFEQSPYAGTCTESPFLIDGYTFAGDFTHCINPPGGEVENADNGTAFLVEGSEFLTITNNMGLTFSARRVDLGASFFNVVSPNFLTVTGTLEDNSVVFQEITLTNDFGTFELQGFDNLVALTFSGLLLSGPDGSFGYYALDNLALETAVVENPGGSVPLPGTIPLALASLAGLTLSQRMRRRG